MHHALQHYRSQLALLGCGFLVLLCPVLLILRDVQVHNGQLDVIARSIYNRALPATTTILDRNAYVANLGGSGKACDYVAEQTMQTALTRTEILAHYHVIQGPTPEPIGRGRTLPEPAQYYRARIEPWFVTIIIPEQQKSPKQLVFTLQILDGRDDAGFDLRCF